MMRHTLSPIIPLLLSGLLLSACNSNSVIVQDLDQQQANQILVLLNQHGISSEKERVGSEWQITVPPEEHAQALTVIDSSHVMKRELHRILPQSGSVVPTKEERAFVAERQLAWSIERTLERIPFVHEARVHLHSASGLEPSLRRPSPHASSASVLLLTLSGREVQRQDILRLVSGASGIASEKITLVISDAGVTAEMMHPTPTSSVMPLTVDDTERSPSPEREASPIQAPTIDTSAQEESNPLRSYFRQSRVIIALGVGTAILLGSILVLFRRKGTGKPERSRLSPPVIVKPDTTAPGTLPVANQEEDISSIETIRRPWQSRLP